MTPFLVAIFCVLAVIKVPVAIALGASTAMTLSLFGKVPLSGLIQRLVFGADSFLLLAIPLFILAGKLMNVSGVTERIFAFATDLVGFIPGSLGHANIVASIIFAGMSGSALADAGGLGVIEMKAMTDAGYPKKFSAAVTAASSTIGPIIPPSIPMVLYASMAGVSVGKMFMGGIVPGLLMGAALMILVYAMAVRRGYPRSRLPSLRVLGKSFARAFFPLLTPVIIIGGIVTGFCTPTEASAIAVAYAGFLGMAVYREIKPADIPGIIIETMVTTAMVVFILAMASSFSWILTIERIGASFQSFVFSWTSDKYVILFLLNVLLLFLGCFMETTSAMILAIPVLIPLVQTAGIDLVHFGVIAVLNLMIGLVTPPVGVGLFVTADIAGVKVEELMSAILPFLIPLIVSLALTTYIPQMVLW